MFGGFGGGFQRFNQQKRDAEKAPRVTVDYDTFVAKCIASGMSEHDAKLHANISEAMGAGVETLIGGEMLIIKAG